MKIPGNRLTVAEVRASISLAGIFGLRMLGIGGAAGALTYAIGHLLGVNLG